MIDLLEEAAFHTALIMQLEIKWEEKINVSYLNAFSIIGDCNCIASNDSIFFLSTKILGTISKIPASQKIEWKSFGHLWLEFMIKKIIKLLNEFHVQIKLPV